MISSPYRLNFDKEYDLGDPAANNVGQIISNSELSINIFYDGVPTKRQCYFSAENIDCNLSIRLTITEKVDRCKMYISTIDTNAFHDLKQDQSLHVTFSGFIENLIKILRDCQKGALEIDLMQNKNDRYILRFYEMRAFKNLIHLCLPVERAPPNIVLLHANHAINNLEKINASHERAMMSIRSELNLRTDRVNQLEAENAKLRESLSENDKATAHRFHKDLQQMQDTLRKASEDRLMENEKHMKVVSALQGQLSKVNDDNLKLITEKCQETKKCDQLRSELSSLNSTLNTITQKNEKLIAEIAVLSNHKRKSEMQLNDARNHVQELQEKIKKHDKIKSDLLAELEAEKNICHTKRKALEMATDEITKANEIISKQTREHVKLKKTISWRTEIALRQEKVLQEKEHQLTSSNAKIESLQQIINDLRRDIPHQLESARKAADSIEKKYSEKLSDLKRRLTGDKLSP